MYTDLVVLPSPTRITRRAHQVNESHVEDQHTDLRALSPPTTTSVLVVAAVSFVVAVVVIGPGLSGGALFQLDRSVVPDAPFPWGTFGLGPEIPRDAPLSALLWLLSVPFGSLIVGKWLMVVTICAAWTGMFRLARRCAPAPLAMVSGFLYVLSPYMLTRLAVGHQAMWVAAAVLPWVLPTLTNARSKWSATFLACVALCIAGSFGGIVAGLVLAGRFLTRDGRLHFVRHTGALLFASAMWLIPGVVVIAAGPTLASSASFPNGTTSLLDVPRLAAGQGFWQRPLEVAGGNPLLDGAAGLILLALAIIGARRLPAAWRGPMAVAATLSFLLSMASAVPILRDGMDSFTGTAIGAPFREAQRYLLLYVAWMALAVPLGASVLARRFAPFREVALLTPVAIGVLLAAPGTWGLGGRLQPIAVPPGWTAAREMIRDGGGTTMVLPWNRYIALRFAEVPRSLNPMAKFLGTDVLVASDLGLGSDNQERTDEREFDASYVAYRILTGDTDTTVEDLDILGVRWVVVLHEGPYTAYLPGIFSSSLEPVIVRGDIELYEVPGWQAEGVTGAGDAVPVSGIAGPLATSSTTEAFTWHRSYQTGWLRGGTPVSEAEHGLMAVPAGSGPIWFWPSLLCLAGYLAVGITMAMCLVRGSRARDPGKGTQHEFR